MVCQTSGAAGHVAPWFSSVASVPSPPQSSDTEIASVDQQEEQVKRMRATVAGEHLRSREGICTFCANSFSSLNLL